MKADEYMRSTPIIVITANSHAIDHYIRGNLMTVEACLEKPLLARDVAAAVMEILGLADQEGA
jgi:precorrin-4 methylase